MRMTIKFDSAETERVREMAKALHNVGLTGRLMVGLNGPERWAGETPPMQPWQFASVVANLVKWNERTIAEVFAEQRKAST